MSNEWRAIERVGEDIGLEDEDLRSFLNVARGVYRKQWEDKGENYRIKDEFFEFLRREVLPEDEVLNLLRQLGVDSSTISELESTDFSVSDCFRTNHRFSFGLDELVDFIMLIKMVQDYQDITGLDSVSPLDRLHYLTYLVNDELANETDYSARPQSVGLGMLERTGYRYTYRKRSHGAYSKGLKRDKDRLYSWNLLDEEVDSSYGTDNYHPLAVSLGSSGKILSRRHKDQFEELENANSNLLREWHFKQKDVLQRYAHLDIQELRKQVQTINDFNSKPTGRVLLAGRARVFDSEDAVISGLSEEIQNV